MIMTERQQIRNIAIVAHVDAGKTSITENMLYLSGAIRSQGNVDKGTALTDNLAIEKQRGISVKATLTSLKWENIKINLIDSPGHADFASEVERSLLAVDGVVLLISAPDGIQSQTAVLWQVLKRHKIPVLLFINKLDRPGTDLEFCMDELRKELSSDLVLLQNASDVGTDKIEIINNQDRAILYDEAIEIMANNDEELMEAYLEDQLPAAEQLLQILAGQSCRALVYPVLLGSAKTRLGIRALLNGMVDYLPAPDIERSELLSGIAFRVTHDKSLGRMVGLRLHSGVLRTKDVIDVRGRSEQQKVNQIKVSSGGKLLDVNEIAAGDIAMVSGLTGTYVGDSIGRQAENNEQPEIAKALLTTQVEAVNELQYASLAAALQELSLEDPSLMFNWIREEREMHLNIMGWIQIDVLKNQLLERYAVKAEFKPPKVVYMETPAGTAHGSESYTMPKPCWAVVTFKIEPNHPGAGVSFSSKVSVDEIHQKYQNEIEKTIPHALKQGIKGWEVCDCRITLVNGEDHEVHSRPGDFILATQMGIMKALSNCKTQLLEPMLRFKLSAPESMLGQIISDITQMRGGFESPQIGEDLFTLEGTLPLATSMDYSVKLTSRSGGKARIQTSFLEYRPCEESEGEVRDYIGINPLDRSKYILKWRGAIQ
jgi:ribosomal protection tetracycline resistance protein